MDMHEALAIYRAGHSGAVVKVKTVDPGEAWDVLVQHPGEPASEYVSETLLDLAVARGVCPEIIRQYGCGMLRLAPARLVGSFMAGR